MLHSRKDVPNGRPVLMDADDAALDALAAEIMGQGYDEKTAWHYAALIGDTPCVDEQGNILVMDETWKNVLARLKPLKAFTLD